MRGSRWITDPDYTSRPLEEVGAVPATRTELRGTGVGDEVPQGEGYVVVTGKYTWLGLYYDPTDLLAAPEYIDVELLDDDLIVYHSRETATSAMERAVFEAKRQGREPEKEYPFVEPLYLAKNVWETKAFL